MVMPRRVRRPNSHDDLLNKLTDKEKSGIFETYKDALLFAASLGAFKGKSKSFDKSSEPIDYGIFSKRSDNEAIIHLLAIYKRNDIEILSDEHADERVTILEEYANAGLEIIDKKLKNSVSTLDAILDLIHENKMSEVQERDFSDIVNSLKVN